MTARPLYQPRIPCCRCSDRRTSKGPRKWDSWKIFGFSRPKSLTKKSQVGAENTHRWGEVSLYGGSPVLQVWIQLQTIEGMVIVWQNFEPTLAKKIMNYWQFSFVLSSQIMKNILAIWSRWSRTVRILVASPVCVWSLILTRSTGQATTSLTNIIKLFAVQTNETLHRYSKVAWVQCDQIRQSISLWATFQSLWQ